MKIKITSSCEDSSILTISIIDVEISSNFSLNLIISLGPTPHFHFVTRMLYTRKVIIANNRISD